MQQRRVVSSVATAILCGLAVWFVHRNGDGPGTRSGGTPSSADYCNVMLVPSVAEAIGLDLPLRLVAARKGSRLLHDLRQGKGRTPLQVMTNTMNDAIGAQIVANHGHAMRTMLPLEARLAFDRLFDEGKLVRVGFLFDEDEEEADGPRRFLVTYGWYDEEKDRKEVKSLARLEQTLRACHQWIPSDDDAEWLLDHENEDVRAAAEAYLDVEDADDGAWPTLATGSRSRPPASHAANPPSSRIAAPPSARWIAERQLEASPGPDQVAPAAASGEVEPSLRNAEIEASAARFRASRDAAAQKIEATRRRMAEEEARRAVEREAFRERVRTRQEAVKQRMAERRRTGR